MPADLTPAQLQWVEALESSEYKQGHGTLEMDGKNCCLGVACREYIKAGEPNGELRARQSFYSTAIYFNEFAGTLPHVVRRWLGTNDGSPTIGPYDAVEMNDNYHMSFERIATEIRAHGIS